MSYDIFNDRVIKILDEIERDEASEWYAMSIVNDMKIYTFTACRV